MFNKIRRNISDSIDDLSFVVNDIDISCHNNIGFYKCDIEKYIDEITTVLATLETVKENLESLL